MNKIYIKIYGRRKFYHEIFLQIYDIIVCNDKYTKKRFLHQWIMYTYVLGEINTTWYLLLGKQSYLFQKNYKKYYLSATMTLEKSYNRNKTTGISHKG